MKMNMIIIEYKREIFQKALQLKKTILLRKILILIILQKVMQIYIKEITVHI
jgi:hypothetical protein